MSKCFFFFFKQKTAYEMCGRDWSSDVCSSDLQWIRLKDAATMLQCPAPVTQQILTDAQIESRFSKRKNRPLYRRGDVERVMQERSSGGQLSVL